jgi:AhpD family alkylhydroperoxidase
LIINREKNLSNTINKGEKMPIFKQIQESEAKGKVKEIFDEIKSVRQITEVPNFWKSLANNPETLERTWTSLQQVMKKGALDPVVKELIYVAVSVTNGCEYCIKSHSLAAKKKGATDEMLNEMIAVTGMANETNRLVEGYQVEVDDFMK